MLGRVCLGGELVRHFFSPFPVLDDPLKNRLFLAAHELTTSIVRGKASFFLSGGFVSWLVGYHIVSYLPPTWLGYLVSRGISHVGRQAPFSARSVSPFSDLHKLT